MGRITSLEVARLAGVFSSAVSRSFTEGVSIAPETRARVIAAASTLSYRVNMVARGLKDQRTRIVGLVASDLEHSLRSTLIERLARL
ncbi:LacI family DNA-binding transcriptional regulator [Pseudogemmobacter sonorensis]|uniref:LacI family DNA-binding transcriptional regulator n=1 Tax=Pseudogemmobacter sonorensis TaxID=2989681 RepID=UPI0036C0EA6C